MVNNDDTEPSALPTKALHKVIEQVQDALGPGRPEAVIFANAFMYTWDHTVCISAHSDPDHPEYFVRTGDIPAMWLRDSTNQMRPYLAAAADPNVLEVLVGVLRRQQRCIALDPYANAFNDGPTDQHGEPDDIPTPDPWIWERKFELDSLCAPLQLGYAIWRASGSVAHLDAQFRTMATTIVDLMVLEQEHSRSSYRFTRPHGPFSGDTLPNDGHGSETGQTGMIWSGFRPSDDRCEFGYLIPANALAVCSLGGLAEICDEVWKDHGLQSKCLNLAGEIDKGIREFGTVATDTGSMLALEVDGLGGRFVADDANLPSLLSLPVLGWIDREDDLYRRTREWILSPKNPYYYSGFFASGIGSPHTPEGYVWPIAIATAGLTGNRADAEQAASTLAATTGDTGFIHESFNVDDPLSFTRPWFGWANAVYSELILHLAGVDLAGYFPKRPQ